MAGHSEDHNLESAKYEQQRAQDAVRYAEMARNKDQIQAAKAAADRAQMVKEAAETMKKMADAMKGKY